MLVVVAADVDAVVDVDVVLAEFEFILIVDARCACLLQRITIWGTPSFLKNYRRNSEEQKIQNKCLP